MATELMYQWEIAGVPLGKLHSARDLPFPARARGNIGMQIGYRPVVIERDPKQPHLLVATHPTTKQVLAGYLSGPRLNLADISVTVPHCPSFVRRRLFSQALPSQS